MREVFIHSHALKHGLTEDQIRFAWEHFLASQPRTAIDQDIVVRIGCDKQGEMIQMVGRLSADGVLVYHAMTPPTPKVMHELGLKKR